jgi:polar amino acid transport system substrate-binding protein
MSYASYALGDEKVIPAWTYYEFGPFITSRGKGLTYDFTELLNRSLQKAGLRIKVAVYPRKRLEKILTKRQGIVLFVNPIWMHDREKTRYLWSPPLLSDRNEILSRMNGPSPTKIVYEGVESLNGLRMGGVLGRSYKDIDDAVNRGNIIRDDASKESQTLKKLVMGRVDFMTSSGSLIRYLVKDMGLEKRSSSHLIPCMNILGTFLFQKNWKKNRKSYFTLFQSWLKTPNGRVCLKNTVCSHTGKRAEKSWTGELWVDAVTLLGY